MGSQCPWVLIILGLSIWEGACPELSGGVQCQHWNEYFSDWSVSMDQIEKKQQHSVLTPVYLYFLPLFWNAFESFFSKEQSLSQIRTEQHWQKVKPFLGSLIIHVAAVCFLQHIPQMPESGKWCPQATQSNGLSNSGGTMKPEHAFMNDAIMLLMSSPSAQQWGSLLSGQRVKVVSFSIVNLSLNCEILDYGRDLNSQRQWDILMWNCENVLEIHSFIHLTKI